jgi:hypothetical protein
MGVDMTPVSIFGRYAHQLLDMGYSPIPLKSDRSPLLKSWQRLRDEQLSRETVDDLAGKHDWLGLAVAGGFNGLVPIDFDTDDHEIMAVVAKVLPRPPVAKHGSKGFTAFYRSDQPIKGCKLLLPPPNAKPIIEVLTSGNCAIPPTMHPKINRPYRWITGETLFDTLVTDLTAITPEHIERLRDALSPWCPKREHAAVPTVDRLGVNSRRMAAFAQARIRNECARLASTSRGRNNALFCAAAALGTFVHNRIVSEYAVLSALMHASRRNGYITKDGEPAALATIHSGLAKARCDRLPDLDALRQSPSKERDADAVAHRS